MSKKYKGKICVYCGQAESASTDHVFARKFFLETDRAGLPQVPSCDACNRAKSTLEHYLSSLLPFGGRHSGARDNLELVPGRLAKNKKLHGEIAAGWRQVWAKEGGTFLQTATVPTDSGRIEDLFALIVRGLIWSHWKTYLTRDHFVQVWALTDAGERWFEENLFGKHAANQVACNLGNGTVCYEGKQGVDQPEITAWRIVMYGGLKFADPHNPDESSSAICAITGPNSAKRTAKQGAQRNQ